jgi:hypothetical protein
VAEQGDVERQEGLYGRLVYEVLASMDRGSYLGVLKAIYSLQDMTALARHWIVILETC